MIKKIKHKYQNIISDSPTDYAYYDENGEVFYLKEFSNYIDNIYFNADINKIKNQNEKKLFDYCINNIPLIKKDFYFIGIKVNDRKNDIIDLINQTYNRAMFLEYKDMLLFIVNSDEYPDLKLLNTIINEELYLDCYIYGGPKIRCNKPKSLYYYLVCYKYFKFDSKVVDVSNLVLTAIKKNTNELSYLKEYILGSLIDQQQMEKILLSYFSNNLNASKTGQDIYMHRNTINKKIDEVKKYCGMNMQVYRDTVAMYFLINYR